MAQPFVPPCQEGRIAAEPCPKAAGRNPSAIVKRVGLTASVLASSMAFIDGSALTVALPALKNDLSGNLNAVQWVLNGYVLALAAFTMIGGALADAYGRARILRLGCAGFALASIACALAPNAGWLIAARIAQGAAAAAMTPASLALIGELYPKEERGRAIGVWAAASALTTAAGPVLGGWLTEEWSWRAIFWINPPIALAAIFLLQRTKTRRIHEEAPAFDIPGAALLAVALALFSLGVSSFAPSEGEAIAAISEPNGGDQGTKAAGFALLGAALAAAFGFLRWERTAKTPLIPSYLFRSPSFSALNAATLAIYASLSIMFFLTPFQLVETRGLSPTQAGLIFLPLTLSLGLLSQLVGGLVDRIGARLFLILGPGIAALSFLLMALLVDRSLFMSVLMPMGLAGIGLALMVGPLTTAVMASVADPDEGLASGVNNTASRIAQMLGVALAALFAARAHGFVEGMFLAAALAALGAFIMAITRERPTR
ncbi:MAG: MFS transporter [Pseudomonadota bacterium]